MTGNGAGLALVDVIAGQGGPQGAAGIACRRLNPDVVEDTFTQNLAVGDAIERHAAGQTQIASTGFPADAARQLQHDVFGHGLDRGGHVHVELGQRVLVGLTHGLPEQAGELVVGHGQAGTIIEVALVQVERAVFLHVNDIFEDGFGIFGLAIGRQSHDLVFAGIDLETGVIGDGGIKQAEGMGEMQFLVDFQGIARSHGQGGGGPLAHPVHGEHGGILERRREKKAEAAWDK